MISIIILFEIRIYWHYRNLCYFSFLVLFLLVTAVIVVASIFMYVAYFTAASPRLQLSSSSSSLIQGHPAVRTAQEADREGQVEGSQGTRRGVRLLRARRRRRRRPRGRGGRVRPAPRHPGGRAGLPAQGAHLPRGRGRLHPHRLRAACRPPDGGGVGAHRHVSLQDPAPERVSTARAVAQGGHQGSSGQGGHHQLVGCSS